MKTTTAQKITLALVFVALLLALIFACRGCTHPEPPQIEYQVQRDTITIRDTVTIIKPEPTETKNLASVTATLPIAAVDTTARSRDHPPDSARVEIPIEQHHYADPRYDAWVSGYRAQLDSLKVYPETTTIHATETITKYKNKRWGLSVGAGAAVTTHGKVEPGIFIGVTYTFFTF